MSSENTGVMKRPLTTILVQNPRIWQKKKEIGCAVFHYDRVVRETGLCQVKRNFLRGEYEFPRSGEVMHFHVPGNPEDGGDMVKGFF